MAEGPAGDGGRRPVDLGEIARATGGSLRGDPDVVVSGATHDSRKVQPGWLFCAVRGEHLDGLDFVDAAVDSGAVALLTQVDPGRSDVPHVLVDDVRGSMAVAAATVHGKPSERLRIVGVTGTNGKTTVVSLLGDVLRRAGRRTEVVGTLTGSRTTPESTDLQEMLAGFVAAGTTDVVMEVSSHALSLNRVDGITFDASVFTNLGRDHLDFHGNPEAYFAAKAKLFEPQRCRHAVLNLDDVHGRLLSDTVEVPVSGFSLDGLSDLAMEADGSRFTWHGENVQLLLPGEHNVSNALAAAEAALVVGLAPEVVAAGISGAEQVPGRFEVVRGAPDGSPTVVVDYAHTPDALENVLGAARVLLGSGGRVVVVFGCGGDRDADKRPLMGRVATEGADRVTALIAAAVLSYIAA